MPLKQAPAPSLKPPLSERDHIIGADSATIELVEYGDFQCPHCGRAYAVVNQLREDFGDSLKFAYRHFPLSKMHEFARKAAETSEAAATQGKFWEMHDLLYENNNALQIPSLISYAGRLGLDVQKFETELLGDFYSERVQEDLSSGIRSGVNGTPTFFINGKRHNSGYDYEILKAAIDTAMGG